MYIKVLGDETKDESSYDVHIFKYSCQKKFLISLWAVIVLLLNEKPFLATAFEFVYVTLYSFLVLQIQTGFHWHNYGTRATITRS